MRKIDRVWIPVLVLSLAACGTDDGGGGGGGGGAPDDPARQSGDALEISGLWEDEFGGSFDIHDTGWGDQTVVEYDNSANVAITQNPPGVEHLPATFNKVVWTEPEADGGFFVCTVGFGHETAELARADEATADPTNPAEAGCGPFAWSRMGPGIEVFGRWESNFGGLTAVSRRAWGDSRVERFDNVTNTAITQNRADDPWNPGKYNRVQWTDPSTGVFHFCMVAFGKDSAADAEADPATADPSDPAAGGCGGFPWTKLFAPIEVHGHFEDQFGFAMGVASGTWGGSTVVQFDNDTNVAVSQAPADAQFGAGQFSRITWTQPDWAGEFFWCTEAFGKATLAEALADPAVADATDPAAGGCGEFAWSKATPTPEVFGDWVDNFGGGWVIGGGKWGAWSMVSFNNASNRAIVQYPDDDEFNPGTFSKVFWTSFDEDGGWAYCSANFGKATSQEADEGPESADPTDLDGAGCGGFPWTRMTAKPADPE